MELKKENLRNVAGGTSVNDAEFIVFNDVRVPLRSIAEIEIFGATKKAINSKRIGKVSKIGFIDAKGNEIAKYRLNDADFEKVVGGVALPTTSPKSIVIAKPAIYNLSFKLTDEQIITVSTSFPIVEKLIARRELRTIKHRILTETERFKCEGNGGNSVVGM